MRDREEILEAALRTSSEVGLLNLLLEVALDIRDLCVKIADSQHPHDQAKASLKSPQVVSPKILRGVLSDKEVRNLPLMASFDYMAAAREFESAVLLRLADIAGKQAETGETDDYSRGWWSAMQNFASFLRRKAGE